MKRPDHSASMTLPASDPVTALCSLPGCHSIPMLFGDGLPGGDYLLLLSGPVETSEYRMNMDNNELRRALHREINEQLVTVPLSAKPDATHDLGTVTVELPELGK